MKKSLITLTIMLAATAMIAAFSCPAIAAVSGQCSACHTMHDSQGGADMAVGGPHAALLLNTCIGCHTTPTGTPQDPYANATPFVKSTSDTTAGLNDDHCLAGGFFPHDTMGTGDNADNHHGMGNTNDPAGMTSGAFYDGSTGFGCGGINGCHGNETDLNDMDAISGGHHNTAQTYRMLYVGNDIVRGDPAVDYEKAIIANPSTPVDRDGATTQNVNIYSAGTAASGEATISELCGKCHGDFHGANGTPSNGTTNAAGEWIRHPSDTVLPTGWTMAGQYAFDGDDAKNNPFGYTDATYTGNVTQATCLSCHRAHGTENADLLRWDYGTQLAGGGSVDYGCLGCHNAQR